MSRIALGAIRKPHGVRGEASVEPWTEFERFSEVHDVTLVSPDESNTRDVKIEASRAHAGRALLKVSGIETPEEMALYRDWTIEVPEDEARKLEPDEYFCTISSGSRWSTKRGRSAGASSTRTKEAAACSRGRARTAQVRSAFCLGDLQNDRHRRQADRGRPSRGA